MSSKFKIITIIFLPAILVALSCNQPVAADNTATEEVQTPVTVTSISNDTISDEVILNATSVFQQKSIVKANINGYIRNVNTSIGKLVGAGQSLFSIRTKESETIGNSVSILDSSLHFSGMNNIKASTAGYITELNHQPGDYVQDGEQLAVISNQNSFVFLLNLPYEDKPLLSMNKSIRLELPDGQSLTGIVASLMPAVDSVAQTQGVVIRVSNSKPIPENLVARVHLVKNKHYNSATLPRAAVLTDDSQTYSWVMKLIDSTTAVRVDIKKGIMSGDRIEIVDPVFLKTDQFLLSGNFGLPDTARVIITKPQP